MFICYNLAIHGYLAPIMYDIYFYVFLAVAANALFLDVNLFFTCPVCPFNISHIIAIWPVIDVKNFTAIKKHI